MKNVYLRINYGCDDRFNMVSRTIRVSAPYFKQIRIANLGPDKNSEKFSLLLKEFPNLCISNLGKYYHSNITEDLVRYHYMDIPDGEWGLVLDSDWRLSPYFLEHMQEEIETCEMNGFNHIFSYQLAHYKFGPNDTYTEYTQEEINKRIEEWSNKPDSYGFPLLQKIDKKNLWFNGFLGNHSYVIHIPYNKKYVPKMYHLHLRNFGDHAYCSSMIHQSWWYIGHNVFKPEEQAATYNSWEYDAIENFKIKYRCFTSNDFHEMKETPEFCEKLKNLFLLFKDSKVFGCRQMYSMATKYDMMFLETNSDLPCNGVCCNYKCGKIKDLPI